MKHHIIYVPGISDDILRVQTVLIQIWRLFGVHPHMHAMPWLGNEAFSPKLQRLTDLIDELHDAGRKVSLIGASAGASAVIHAYDARKSKIAGLVYVCGKINRPEAVSGTTYRENPAFKESLERLPAALERLSVPDKAKMLSLYSRADKTVPHADTIVAGVQEKSLPPAPHGRAIVYAISLGARLPLGFLRHAAEQM